MDAQQLVNDVLKDSFNQLLHQLLHRTRVEGKVVRLREQAG